MRDLFVLHADADAAFVRGQLVPAVNLAPDRVLLSSDLPLGMSIVEALEQGVAASRVTVAVLSPSFLHDGWTSFGEQLAGHHHNAGAGRLVPLLLVDCAVPLRLDYRVKLDCRAADDRAAAFDKLRALLGAPAPVDDDIPCPYPGMRPFAPENAALFCGRDREIDDLVSRLAGGLRELYVIGPSGSGKSSLLLSAVAPRLERVSAVVRDPFVTHVLRPGADPADRVRAVTAARDGHHLLVVDQLEEIFTLADDAARAAFFTALAELRAQPTWTLAFTVRSDFYGTLMQSPLWPFIRRAHRAELDPLRGDDLRAAITLPARRVRVELEPALVDRLLADAADEPGSLPLVQETLVHLWTKRDGRLLTAGSYARLGEDAPNGLAVALARHADTALSLLDDDGRAIARRTFLRLVAFGEGRANTRRQQPLTALGDGEDPARFAATLRRLVDARLLTADALITRTDHRESSQTVIDLAHEIAIESWPTLRAWIAAGRQREQRRRALETRAQEWLAADRAGRFLDVAEYLDAESWIDEAGPDAIVVSADARALVRASRDRHEAEKRAITARARRLRRWTRFALITLVTAVALVSTLAVLAYRSSRNADTQAQRANLSELAIRDQLSDAYLDQALALIGQGRAEQSLPYVLAACWSPTCTREERALAGFAIAAIPRSPAVSDVRESSWLPDGLHVLSGDDVVETVWRFDTGNPTEVVRQATAARWLVRSKDGELVVTVQDDDGLEIRDGHGVLQCAGVVTSNQWNEIKIRQVVWSADSRHIAVATDREVQVYDVDRCAWLPLPSTDRGTVVHLAFGEIGPAASLLAISHFGREVQVVDVASGTELWFGVAGYGGSRLAWDRERPRLLVADVRVGDEYRTVAVVFPSVTKLAAGPLHSDEDTSDVGWAAGGLALEVRADRVAVWDVGTVAGGERELCQFSQSDSMRGVVTSPDNRTVAVYGQVNVRLWDLPSCAPISPRLWPQFDAVAAQWSPDGRWLGVRTRDHRIEVWDTHSIAGAELGDVQGGATAIVRSPTGADVAAGTDAALLVVHEEKVQAIALPSGAGVRDIAWHPGGHVFAVATTRGAFVVSDRGTHLDRVTTRTAAGISWSPTGDRLAIASDEDRDGGVSIVHLTSSGAALPEVRWPGDRGVFEVAWSPVGDRLMDVTEGGHVEVRSAESGAVITDVGVQAVRGIWTPSGALIASTMTGGLYAYDSSSALSWSVPHAHAGQIVHLSLSPDGTRLATASLDGTARIWDVATGDAVGWPCRHEAAVFDVQWSPVGGWLATASADHTVAIWSSDCRRKVVPPLQLATVVGRVAWSADGRRVIAGSDGESIRSFTIDLPTNGRLGWAALSRLSRWMLADGHLVRRDQER